jgi:6-phosphofructokinase 2
MNKVEKVLRHDAKHCRTGECDRHVHTPPRVVVTTATERVAPTGKLRCAQPRDDPGGGINVARAIHFLGGEALAVFAAGGPTGKTLRDLLTEEGVPTRVVAIAGRTRESLAADETATGRQYRFVMPGPVQSDAELSQCLDVLRLFDPKPGYLVASGSLPDGDLIDYYGHVAEIAKDDHSKPGNSGIV